jgi:FtsH-binding integral membrane protein
MSYGYEYSSVTDSSRSERAAFIRRTYAHLAVAVLALIGLDALFLQTLDPQEVLRIMWGSRISYLVVFALFMGTNYLAARLASSETSVGAQYLGLGLSVVGWAVMMLPMLIIANYLAPDQKVIQTALIMTLSVFGGLTMAVFVTRKDFISLGPILSVCSFIALGVIIASLLVGFNLGLFFCFAMVALIAGYILYDTSNVMLRFGTHQHVAAALVLFSDVAILFWYILQILLLSNRRD